MTKALITGITGQDGALLAQLLLSKDHEVAGIYRRLSTPNFWRLMSLNILDKVKLYQADLHDATSLSYVLKDFEPDEVYHLAAQSFVDASFKEPIATGEVTGLGTATLLELIRQNRKEIRFYNAATSELYGNSLKESANEDTPFRPSSPYAAAKLYSLHMCRIYREAYGMFVCSGILFNHEGPLRGLEFVTRKVTNAATKIKLGLSKELSLGNLEAQRDWGYAPEYCEAMYLMMQASKPDDFVIATNETHSVKELCSVAFSHLDLSYRDFVKTKEDFLRPLDVEYLKGNPSKAKAKLGWQPGIKFDELVRLMVEADLDRWQRQLKGEIVHWDAMNYE